MRYLKNTRGVTLIELLVTLLISIMIVGIVFLIPSLIKSQNIYNDSFNSAKNQVLLITNTMIERLEQAEDLSISGTKDKIIKVNDNPRVLSEEFIFTGKPNPEDYLYDVTHIIIFKDGTRHSQDLGTVGFNIESPTETTSASKFLIMTIWAPYVQPTSSEGKFVLTQGFHTSVINE